MIRLAAFVLVFAACQPLPVQTPDAGAPPPPPPPEPSLGLVDGSGETVATVFKDRTVIAEGKTCHDAVFVLVGAVERLQRDLSTGQSVGQ